jgi:hypothetical protein
VSNKRRARNSGSFHDPKEKRRAPDDCKSVCRHYYPLPEVRCAMVARLSILVEVACIAFAAAGICQAQDGPAPIAIPPGPYASWSEDSRRLVETRLRASCFAATNGKTPSNSMEARRDGDQAFFASCVLKQMPEDWRQHEGFENVVIDAIARAKRADPTIPDSVFAEITSPSAGPRDARTESAARPMPSGPYASWSEAEKQSVLKTVTMNCGALGAMIFAAPATSQEIAAARKEGMSAFMLSCTANKMPGDWPDRERLKAIAATHAAAAKRGDPSLPDDVLQGKIGPDK